MHRKLLVCLLALALLSPAGALAQGGGAFGPLPPAAPQPTPTPTPIPKPDDGDVSRSTLAIIGAGLLVLFVVIGFVITRDARRTLPEDRRDAKPRDAGPHKAQLDAKAKARAKQRQARQARKRTTRHRKG